MKKFLSTMLVLTIVPAVLLPSCKMVDTMFATPTPTSTNTPTITPSPTSTPTPTITVTPTPIPTGVQTESLSNESILVTDFDNKYQLTLPAGWIVLPLKTEDLSAMISELAENNEKFSDIAQAFEALDEDTVKALALNEDPTYIQNGFGTNIMVAAFEEPVLTTMPMAFVTGALEESFIQQGAIVLTDGTNILTNANGVEVGVIDVEQKTLTATGSTINVVSRLLIFQTESKLILVQIATHKEFQNDLFPSMDEVLESITIFE